MSQAKLFVDPAVVEAIVKTEQRMRAEQDRQARVIMAQSTELQSLRADHAEIEALRKGYQAERDRRWTPTLDATWGAGNWVRCSICPLDATGHEVYHHKKLHEGEGV